MPKRANLLQAVKAAATSPSASARGVRAAAATTTGKLVLIGGNFEPQVRAALRSVASHPANLSKTSKDLLGEAINDLCAKYGVPEPYSVG
jgi:L-lactate utilization protein LutC